MQWQRINFDLFARHSDQNAAALLGGKLVAKFDQGFDAGGRAATYDSDRRSGKKAPPSCEPTARPPTLSALTMEKRRFIFRNRISNA